MDCKSDKLTVRPFDLAWTVLWLSWTIFLLVLNFYFGEDGISEKNTVIRIGLVYLLGFELLGCCFIIIYNFHKRETIQNYMKLLKGFDDEVGG
jgi:hypothetical protein